MSTGGDGTWAATGSKQLISGNALRDGYISLGIYTVDVTIGSEYNNRMVTNTYIEAHTNASGVGSSSRCPTKENFLSQF